MRRAKSSPPISPQQLKHFAAGSVAITCLLALFASGKDWGAKAQIEAVEAKNRMVEAERAKLGTKKVINSVAVREPAAGAGFSDGGAPAPAGDSGGGGGSIAPMPQAPRMPPGVPGGSPVYPTAHPTPGTTVTIKGVPADEAPGVRGKSKPKLQSGPVDAEQARRLKEVSRQRSGSPEGGD